MDITPARRILARKHLFQMFALRQIAAAPSNLTRSETSGRLSSSRPGHGMIPWTPVPEAGCVLRSTCFRVKWAGDDLFLIRGSLSVRLFWIIMKVFERGARGVNFFQKVFPSPKAKPYVRIH